MRYFLGVDGGNSKTHALLMAEDGSPVGFGASGGSDYQEIGLQAAQSEWEKAVVGALSEAGLTVLDIELGCFCLAGADLPEDYSILNEEVTRLVYPMRIIVRNDTIAALQAGLHEASFGVTVVVGTGFNAAGRGKDGQELILPGLGYISGDYGGGRWIARQIIRAVMRAWDGRGPATRLSAAVFEAVGVSNEEELIHYLRKEKGGREKLLDLVPVLFDVAYNGDLVAQSLLINLGTEVGITANNLIRRLGLEREHVPVVLSTSVFRGKGPLLIDVITTTVHQVAPKAHVITPDFYPVVGAALEALDCGGINVNVGLIDHMRQALCKNYPYLISREEL